jgi:exonuclease III
MDPNKIITWNVRGLNSTAGQDSLWTLVESSKADIVCVQETKIANLSQRVVGTCFSDFVVLPAVGQSGGILMAWRQHVKTTGANRVDSSSISVQFQAENGSNWWLTCVYGPQGTAEKITFLQELREVREACSSPWVLVGDFNLIYKDEDKSNSNYNRAMIGRFRMFINDQALKEIPLHGMHLVKSACSTNLGQVRQSALYG